MKKIKIFLFLINIILIILSFLLFKEVQAQSCNDPCFWYNSPMAIFCSCDASTDSCNTAWGDFLCRNCVGDQTQVCLCPTGRIVDGKEEYKGDVIVTGKCQRIDNWTIGYCLNDKKIQWDICGSGQCMTDDFSCRVDEVCCSNVNYYWQGNSIIYSGDILPGCYPKQSNICPLNNNEEPGNNQQANFNINIIENSKSIKLGETAIYNIVVETFNYTGNINLSVQNCPSGATCSLSTSSIQAIGNNQYYLNLIIQNTNNLPINSYIIKAVASDNITSKEDSAELIIEDNTCPNDVSFAPLNYWHRVWCDKNFVQKISDGPHENELSFNNDWGYGYIAGLRQDNIGFRSKRTINFPFSGNYEFILGSDDGVRVWIDNVLVLDEWYDRPYATSTFIRNISAGNHIIRIDYYENMGEARVSFYYNYLGNPIPNYKLTVNKNGSGSGVVISNLPGINCGSDCEENYNSGTELTLQATPSQGSIFSGWSGDCYGISPTCKITMNNNQNVIAIFNQSFTSTSTTTHLECNSSNQCVAVQGSGPNRCSSDFDCGSGGFQFRGICKTQIIGESTAFYCVNEKCTDNCISSCKNDAECQNSSSQNHLECYNNACVIVSGSGQNKCSTIGQGCRSIREIIPFNPPSLNQFLKQTASIFLGLR
jgi:hypothetical protein